MALEDYRADGMRCNRCSYCKWIPLDRVKSWEFAKGCPSVDYRHFHAYSAGGRLISMLSLTDGRSEISDEMIDVAFECTLCGQCDVSCKVCRYDMHILSAAREFRHYLNEKGHVPEAYPGIIGRLRNSRNMAGAPQAKRAGWSEGLGVKTLGVDGVYTAEVLFHAGCQYSFDPNLRTAVQAAAKLLTKGGVDFAIDGDEGCCGGKAYDMGYRDDFASIAEANLKKWTQAGVKTVVTPCATCFWTFKRLYPKVGPEVEVLHTVQVVDHLLKDGKLQLTTPVPITVTYHDPCHLGRQGEDYVAWDGKEVKIYGQAVVYDPPRPRYNGAFGVYEPPRDVLKAIPGLELVEMERTKEAAWCCGGGGAVPQAYPEFGAFTAGKRLDEAKSTGAEAVATACPDCVRMLGAAVAADGAAMKVIDVLELVEQAL
jgi:Fe-S oxidoreductase